MKKISTDKCGIGKQNTCLQITSIDYGNLKYADNLNYSFKMQAVNLQATHNKLEKFLWNHVRVYHGWKLLIAKGVCDLASKCHLVPIATVIKRYTCFILETKPKKAGASFKPSYRTGKAVPSVKIMNCRCESLAGHIQAVKPINVFT